MTRLELTSFRMLIDQVVDRARPHLRQIYPAIVVPAMVAGVLMALYQHSIFALALAQDAASIAVVFLSLLGFVALVYLTLTALGVASMDALLGRPVDMKRAWLFSFRPKAAITLFSTTAILVAAAFGPFMLFALALPFAGAIVAVLLLLLSLPIVIVVVPLLSFVVPVMVAEERFAFSAIGRSMSLAWVNRTGKLRDSGFAQSLTLMVVGWMVINGLGVLVQGPVAMVQQYLAFRASADNAADLASMLPPLWFNLPAQALSLGLTAAAWAYWSFGFGMLYLEIRRRREAYDLDQAIDALASPASAAPAEG